jgi:nucleoid DNA-binding protein
MRHLQRPGHPFEQKVHLAEVGLVNTSVTMLPPSEDHPVILVNSPAKRTRMTKTPNKPETISLAELSASFAEAHDLTKARAKVMLDGIRDEIVHSLLSNKRVNVFGLGTFEVRATTEKMGRNPKTGEKIQIPAGRKVVFKAAKGIKEQM